MAAASRRSAVVEVESIPPLRAPRGKHPSRRSVIPSPSDPERKVRGSAPWTCADAPAGALLISFPPEYDRSPGEKLLGDSQPPRGPSGPPPTSASSSSSSKRDRPPRGGPSGGGGHSSGGSATRSDPASPRPPRVTKGNPSANGDKHVVRMLEGHDDAVDISKKHLTSERNGDTDDDTNTTESNSTLPTSLTSSSDFPEHPSSISVGPSDILAGDEFKRRMSLFGGH